MFTKSIKIALFIAILGLQLNAAFSTSLYFSKNVGQIQKPNGESVSDILYVLNTNDVNCYFFNNKLGYSFHVAGKPMTDVSSYFKYNVKFENALNNINIMACNKLDNDVQYFQGKIRAKITNYEKLLYQNVYKNIDIEYLVKDNGLKYNIKVKPGGDPSEILNTYEGNLSLELKNNQLLIKNANNAITEDIPEAYYFDNNGAKIQVQCKYILKEGNKVGFEVSNYDRTKELIIDPIVKWSTYLGFINKELIGRVDPDLVPFQKFAFLHYRDLYSNPPVLYDSMSYQTGGIFIDTTKTDSNKYVIGSTFSHYYYTPGFPEVHQSAGPFHFANEGQYDIFVAKYNKVGRLIASFVLGGHNNDFGMDLVVQQDTVYIVGTSNSSDFPVSYPPITTYGGGYDVVYCKILANLDINNGYDFPYSSYIGGSGDDIGHSLTVDNTGLVSLVGETVSSNFPLWGYSTQPICSSCAAGFPDAFFFQINRASNMPIYSTFIGGNGIDNALAVEFKLKSASSNRGYYYIVGATKSSNFPVVKEIQSYLNNDPTLSNRNYRDGFIHIIDQSSRDIMYSTYYGGIKEDILTSIMVYDSANFVVLGGSQIANSDGNIIRDAYTYIDENGILRTLPNDSPEYNFIMFQNPLFYPMEPDGTIELNENGNIWISKFDKTIGFPYPPAPLGFFPSRSDIFGGSGMDIGNDIKLMNNGDILLVATTDSNNVKLFHSFQQYVPKGNYDNLDVLAMRLRSDFNPAWCSLFRSDENGYDMVDNRASGIAFYNNDITFVGESGNNYIVKKDKDSDTLARSFSSSQPEYQDVFVTTINEESRFPTYLSSVGSNYNDFIEDIYAEPNYIYVTGKTQGRNLPYVLSNDTGSTPGNYDIFVTKYDALTGMPIWSFLYGDTLEDCAKSITKVGNHIFLTGYTKSRNIGVNNNHIPQPDYRPYYGSLSQDAFVMELTENVPISPAMPTTVTVDWFTYLGGCMTYGLQVSGGERIITDFDLDSNKQVLYVCGFACNDTIFRRNSSGNTFGGGDNDGFIARFDTNGTLVRSRWLGGNYNESCLGIAKTFNNRLGVVGYTNSADFPQTDTSIKRTNADQFFTELSTNLFEVKYSIYKGGNGADTAYAIYADYNATGDPATWYSKAYVGGHEFFSATNKIQASVNIYKKQPYTEPWKWKYEGKIAEPSTIYPTESYCYDITGSKDTIYATGYYKYARFAEFLTMEGLQNNQAINNANAYITKSLAVDNQSIIALQVKKGIGNVNSIDVGTAITKGYNLFDSKLQIFAGINTTADTLIDVLYPDLQNYFPYQATRNGLYDGLLVKVQIEADFKLFKEMTPQIEASTVPIIYPNPTKDIINYAYQLSEDSFIEIEIYDIFGNSLVNMTDNKTKGTFFIPINVGSLPSGIYLIRSKINNQIFSNKFVKN